MNEIRGGGRVFWKNNERPSAVFTVACGSEYIHTSIQSGTEWEKRSDGGRMARDGRGK
jgi:hypothetical protein